MGTAVNHPDHYQTKSGLEVIDIIDAVTDVEAFCKGDALKYLCREGKKNGIEDLKKAVWYIQYLIDYKQKEIKKAVDNFADQISGGIQA